MNFQNDERPAQESGESLSRGEENQLVGAGGHGAAQSPASAGHGPLLKTVEAAKYLAISPRQVQNISKMGELPFIQMWNSIRYTRADLDEFIDRCRRRGGRA